jgi:hypothetical protein
MNYGKWHQVFTEKFLNYDYFTCRRALYDCHDTLELRRDLPTDDPYYIKLWAEIDALRDRQHQLNKVKK